MGYAHYWRQKRPFTPAEWQTLVWRRQNESSPRGSAIAVCGPLGTGQPKFTPDAISLNGSAALKEDCETFALERAPVAPSWATPKELCEGVFNFCKTEYRPYDAVVVSILHVARSLAPDAIEVSSDGGPEAIALKF